MAQKLRMKKGDKVIVRTGKDKGKTGEVLRMIPSDNRAVVQGVNMVKRHTRPTQSSAGGIVEKEAPIQLSNVAIVCKSCNKPTRIGVTVIDATVKPRHVQRTCRKCGNSLD